MPKKNLNQITAALLPNATWENQGENGCSLRMVLIEPLEGLTKDQLSRMAKQYGIAALEKLNLRGYESGTSVEDPWSDLVVEDRGNLGRPRDIALIRNIISMYSPQELLSMDLIKTLYSVYIEGEKKLHETVIFPKLKSVLADFSNQCTITYDENQRAFTIQVTGIDQEKAKKLTPDVINKTLSKISPKMEEKCLFLKYDLSNDSSDPYAASIHFGADNYESVHSSIKGNMNFDEIKDNYQDLYSSTLKTINSQISREYAADPSLKLPTQSSRIEDAKKIALDHPERFSCDFRLNLATLQYIQALVQGATVSSTATVEQPVNMPAQAAGLRDISPRSAMTLSQKIMVTVKQQLKNVSGQVSKNLYQFLIKHIKSTAEDGSLCSTTEDSLILCLSKTLIADQNASFEALLESVKGQPNNPAPTIAKLK
jgi:hypothetical protein